MFRARFGPDHASRIWTSCRATTPPASASSASAKPARPSPADLRDTGIETIAAWDILFPEGRGRGARSTPAKAMGARRRDLGSRRGPRRRHHHLRGDRRLQPGSGPLGRAASDRQSVFSRHQLGVARPQEGNREAARRQGALCRRRDPGADPSGAAPDAAAARRSACRDRDAAADRRIGNARRHRRRRGRPGRRPEDDPQRDDQGHRGADARMLPRRPARRHRRRGRGLAEEQLPDARLEQGHRIQHRAHGEPRRAPRRRDGPGRRNPARARHRSADGHRHLDPPARDGPDRQGAGGAQDAEGRPRRHARRRQCRGERTAIDMRSAFICCLPSSRSPRSRRLVARAGSARPAGAPAQAKPDDAPHGPGVLRLLPSDSASDKEITIGGRKIAYTATAGTLPLFDQNGEKTAAVFYTAYVAKDARHRAAARHLRLQRRAGRGLGLYQSRLRWSPHRPIRCGRPRRRRGQTGRQSGFLARLHRSGDDRSDRHRLEPHRQAGRCQELLERPQRRQFLREGDRALCRQEQPRGFAEIPARRKLRRLPRRQGRERVAKRTGHRHRRHRHGVAAA